MNLNTKLHTTPAWTFAILFGIVASAPAFADGFRCVGLKYNNTRFNIENQKNANLGVRNVCKITVSALMSGEGQKHYVDSTFYGDTCASSAGAIASVKSESTRYVIQADSRLRGQYTFKQKNSYVGPYLLTNVSTLILDLNFQYNYPNSHGDSVTGTATYYGETGSQMSENISCTRIKKTN
jgi:hypothetical protein